VAASEQWYLSVVGGDSRWMSSAPAAAMPVGVMTLLGVIYVRVKTLLGALLW
jgi:hypothetical protein